MIKNLNKRNSTTKPLQPKKVRACIFSTPAPNLLNQWGDVVDDVRTILLQGRGVARNEIGYLQ